MVGLIPTLGAGILGNVIGKKLFSKKKKEEEEGIKISDRKATDEEVKTAAEKRRKKLQVDIDAKKNNPTLIGNSFGSGS